MSDETTKKPSLLDDLLAELDAGPRESEARAALQGVVSALKQGVTREAEQEALADTLDALEQADAATARARQQQQAKAKTDALITALLGGPADKPRQEAPAVDPAEAPRRPRREARFGVDDLMALDNRALLRVVAAADPVDLVCVCASRGAGELAERILVLLPAQTRQVLFETIKLAGRTPDDDARHALDRFQQLVTSPSSG